MAHEETAMARRSSWPVLLVSMMVSHFATQPARAESLRCTGGIASEGDSRVAVAFKCGQPTLKDQYCAPVYFRGTWQVVPEPLAGAYVPCQPVEEWLYDRGPGNLKATVRFRAGVVQSIVHAHDPH
jgi:hypothetical protein